MYVLRLVIRHFRGFSELIVRPKRHAVLIGEPGAGRSDIIEGLCRVLDADAIRTRTTTELDFHQRDTAKPIEIEVTIGELGPELEQHFLDNLEIWNSRTGELVAKTDLLEELPEREQEWVLRVAYRGQWLSDQERCEERIFYPKSSDPSSLSFAGVRFSDIEQLGFTTLRWESGRILDLGRRSSFRRLIEQSSGADFAPAINQYLYEITNAAAVFATSEQVREALNEVIGPLREVLGVGSADVSQVVQFAPEGGSSSGLLRSLGPAIDLGDGTGALPAWRRGSTIASLFRLAESLTLSLASGNILAIDDLGDGMDPASAVHFAAVLRRSAGQVWITTRVPSIAEIFEPAEVIRLGRTSDGTRIACQGRTPTTKSEAIAAKHWHRNLLPALSYHSVIVVEGPQDLAAIHALSVRLCKEVGSPLPATYGVTILSAGAMGSGGYANVLRLAAGAREMGLRAIAVVDGDKSAEAKQFLQDHASDADAVIRLPDGVAIELAIVQGVDPSALREALRDICKATGLPLLPNLDKMTAKELEDRAVNFIKGNALHSALIEALPFEHLPVMARNLLEKAVSAARGHTSGVIQL